MLREGSDRLSRMLGQPNASPAAARSPQRGCPAVGEVRLRDADLPTPHPGSPHSGRH